MALFQPLKYCKLIICIFVLKIERGDEMMKMYYAFLFLPLLMVAGCSSQDEKAGYGKVAFNFDEDGF
jgi:hypothetical protein